MKKLLTTMFVLFVLTLSFTACQDNFSDEFGPLENESSEAPTTGGGDDGDDQNKPPSN